MLLHDVYHSPHDVLFEPNAFFSLVRMCRQDTPGFLHPLGLPCLQIPPTTTFVDTGSMCPRVLQLRTRWGRLLWTPTFPRTTSPSGGKSLPTGQIISSFKPEASPIKFATHITLGEPRFSAPFVVHHVWRSPFAMQCGFRPHVCTAPPSRWMGCIESPQNYGNFFWKPCVPAQRPWRTQK